MDNNLLRLIRQSNIFGDPTTSTSNRPNYQFDSIPEDNTDNYDVGARMNELYQPEHEMSDRYAGLIDQMPVRQTPSVWKRLLASAISASQEDPEVGNKVLDAPYERGLKDWGMRLKATEPAANMERQNNTNMRAVANSIISQEQGSRRLERQYSRDNVLRDQGAERIRQGDDKIAQADKRIEQANERLKIAQEVAKGGVLNIDDAGNANIIRKDGTRIPVKGEYLSFEEKEAFKAKTAAARSSATIKTDVIDDPDRPGTKILVRINPDGTYTPVTGKGNGAVATPRPRTETSTATDELGVSRGIVNKATTIKNSNPKWSKWITIDKGKVTIKTPGIFSGPSQDEYQQIYNSIFGNQPRTNSNSGSSPNNTGRGSAPGNPPSNGRVKVIGPNGQTGTVSLEDSKKLPQGWRVQ